MKFIDMPRESKLDKKHFISLKHGEEVTGVLVGDPYHYYHHWEPGQSPVPCTRTDDCQLCKKGLRSSFRFQVNMIVRENDAFVAKILEQGKTVYLDLQDHHNDCLKYNVSIENVKTTLARNGTGTETRYRLKSNYSALSPAILEQLKAVQLHDLEALHVPTAPASSDSFGDDVPCEAPFDASNAPF